MEGTKKVLLVDGGDIDKKLKLATQNLHYVNVLPSIVSVSESHHLIGVMKMA
jgi:ribosomal protein L4